MLMACAQSVLAQKKDTLFLKNNAVLIGQLRKIQYGKIEFDQDGVSILSVKNDRVRTLSAESRTFRIQTTDNKLVYGSLYAIGRAHV